MKISRIRKGSRTLRILLALVQLFVVAAFNGKCQNGKNHVPSRSVPLRLSPNEKGDWINHGLLLSSFSDGLKPNTEAINFLMRGLVASLWREQQTAAEDDVVNSAIQSPCCGPDLDAVMNMEVADDAILQLEEGRVPWQDTLANLVDRSNHDKPLELRFLYIPTAMYALRPDSINTPGKQRQRARADAKKRRNEIVELLSSQLGECVTISALTLDLDDGSIKHAEGSKDSADFPKNGKEAFQTWKPNLIYVQGGNTFWLYHCIEKGNWGDDIITACTGKNPAVYCGTSAGAIVMGQSMDTACWKEWDDPSIVANRASYADWKHVKGFGLVGEWSFFPHMDDTWQSLVHRKLLEGAANEKVICLSDHDVCCVHGNKKTIQILSVSLQLG